MKKASKFALAALAVSLVPFELRIGKDREFSYQSLLIGLSSKKLDEKGNSLTLSLFNLPAFLKKKPQMPGVAVPAETAPDETVEEAPASIEAQQ